jgi:hypothetical protein
LFSSIGVCVPRTRTVVGAVVARAARTVVAVVAIAQATASKASKAVLRNAAIISIPFNWTQHAPRHANICLDELKPAEVLAPP